MITWRIKQLKVFNLHTTENIKEKLLSIQRVALSLEWKIQEYRYKAKKLVLVKNDMMLIINLANNNVETTIQHPKFIRKTTIVRTDLQLSDIAAILFDPRVHTGKGEYKEVKHKNRKNGPRRTRKRRELEVD